MAEYFDDENPCLIAIPLQNNNGKTSQYVQDISAITPKNVQRGYRQHQRSVDSSYRGDRKSFGISTDPLQADKATEIRLLASHDLICEFFTTRGCLSSSHFFGWFSIPPLMPTIKNQLNLSEDQIANTNIAALSSAIIGRLIAGPLCDRYGARTVQAVILVVGAIPVASATLVVDYYGFMLVRFFTGLVGCTFVATAYWTSTMFSNEVVGSANAIAAGWGNLGAGVAYLITLLIFDLVTLNDLASQNYGWRLTLVFPAAMMVIIGICTYMFSDDCPRGNYVDLKKNHAMATRPHRDLYLDFLSVTRLPVTWILAFQYACSFGVEIQVHNVLSLYYYEDFKIEGCNFETDENACRLLTQTKASLISSCFGLMCIFARAVGGYLSDVANRHFDMKGRITIQCAMLLGEAIFLFVFSRVRELGWSIPLLVMFGIFVQACTGSTYGIVPYVSPRHTGVTSGIVGAGGNMGGMAWGFLFKGVGNRAMTFEYMSFIVAGAALTCGGMHIEGERNLWTREFPIRNHNI